MSELRTNRIVPRDGFVSATGVGGGIIQVKTTEKLVHQSIQDGSGINGTPVDIMSVSIIPTRSDSKILVICNVNASCSDAALLYLFRNSTKIAAGTDGNAAARRGWSMPRMGASNECQNHSTTILDEPATTSAVTYTIKGLNESSSAALRINRRDSGDQYGLFSNIVVMEVSG
tara:strand:+ start:126 stop:644 length:519 start_codon:yes stop_codon:yes gene_type:complete